jgi:hypothetical protein
MQKVFYAWSFFTENTDKHLLECLDNILRVISSDPRFDGYSHQKLSTAFWHSQRYLQSIAEKNYLDDKFNWNIHALMMIPMTQFESVLADSSPKSKLDYHAIRLIIALLNHGLNQMRSPELFCELPQSVNAEFNDYLSLALSSKLAVVLPDRLETMLTGDIHNLCQNAWDVFNRQPELSFLDRVRFMLLGIFNGKR